MAIEFLSATHISSILSVILIDVVLGGDNAIVIGMATQGLPKDLQKKAIILGTFGAVAVRIVATIAVVWLLKIPGIQLAGGILLLWIAYRLLVKKEKRHYARGLSGLWSAVATIIIADAAMGIDNILAVAGAARGETAIVIFGLMVSIPIIVWGSTIVIRLIDRFPIITYLGAAVIAYIAGGMITRQLWISRHLEAYPYLRWVVVIAVAAGVVLAGALSNGNHSQNRPR